MDVVVVAWNCTIVHLFWHATPAAQLSALEQWRPCAAHTKPGSPPTIAYTSPSAPYSRASPLPSSPPTPPLPAPPPSSPSAQRPRRALQDERTMQQQLSQQQLQKCCGVQRSYGRQSRRFIVRASVAGDPRSSVHCSCGRPPIAHTRCCCALEARSHICRPPTLHDDSGWVHASHEAAAARPSPARWHTCLPAPAAVLAHARS